MVTGVILALCCAVVWGSGDYCGGRASTRLDAYQVLGLSALSGIALLTVLALATGESAALTPALVPAVGAGLSTSLGIACLYRGLSVGSAAVVAPTAAVVAALVPVFYTSLVAGAPRATQVAGFAVALLGIFLVARSAPQGKGSRAGLRLGLLAGVGFGGFLVLIAQGPPDLVYVPLAISRSMMFLVSLGLLWRRTLPFPSPGTAPLALVAGVLDASGTAFYVAAQQYIRLDVAAVLSSLYPAATVLLSYAIGHERVTATQWAGALLCVGAVALIAA